MRNKGLLTLIALLVIASMVVAGCGGGAQPTAAPAAPVAAEPTAVPVVEEPTEAPVAEEPTAEPVVEEPTATPEVAAVEATVEVTPTLTAEEAAAAKKVADAAAAAAAGAAAQEAMAAAKAAGKTPVRWFVGLGTGTSPDQVAVQQQVVNDFNASQDKIELVLEIVPYDAGRDTLATQIASGAGPDIIGPVGWGGSNAFYGQWLDLAPYIESTGFDTTVFDPALVDTYQTEEGQVGLPFAVFPSAVYYVPAMFDEVELEYPPQNYGDTYMLDGEEVDWNWETFTEVAKRLTIDVNGFNSTEDGFDPAQIVQVGYSPQWQTHPNYFGAYLAGGANVYEGEEKGSFKAAYPDSWKGSSEMGL